MAVIKNLAFCNKSKLKKNSTFEDFKVWNFAFLTKIIDITHHILPLRAKFLSEYFVAFENDEPIGLIGLQATRGNWCKIKITNFFLEKNSPKIGEQLINYAIAKYCAIGANSFFISIEEDSTQMQQLFLKKCGFRVCAREIIFNLSNIEKKDTERNFSVFKPLKTGQLPALMGLYNDCVNAQFKYFFTKNVDEFINEFISPTHGKVSFKFVLENSEKKEIYGFISISTSDNKNYVLDCFLSRAFSSYFLDVVSFAKMQISKRTKEFNLYYKHKCYYYNSQEIENCIKEAGFNTLQRNTILTKDFVNLAIENSIIQNARIIFNDITPAFKV